MGRSRALRLLLALLVLTSAQLASADELADNARRLRSAEDFRVRTQAALALGASRDERAVVPLCQGIRDEHRVVRLASATALARLNSGGAGCLRSQLEREKDAKVKAALEKALDRVGGGGASGPAEPAIDEATKYYVAIDPLSGPKHLKDSARVGFVRGIGSAGDVAIAPAGETLGQAARVLAKHPNAKGFMLSPTVKDPEYSGGTLKIRLSVAILSYPDKVIIGSFGQQVAMGGVSEPDLKAEEELLLAAAESAMKKFLQLAQNL